MLETIIARTLKYRNFVVLGVMAMAAIGVYSYMKLPFDAFPDVTNVQVEVMSEAHGLSALEIERFVTYPIENAMRGLPDVVQMRSITKFGLSVVTIVFEDKVDVYFARQLVFQRLEEARAALPEAVSIGLGPIATAMGEIYQYTLQGNEPEDSGRKIRYLTDLRTIQEWMVTPLLKSVAGVNEINSFGGYFKQYQVLVNPEKLIAHDLSLDDVYHAIEKNNENAGGNVLDRFDEQYIVRGVGLL
jgi:cobalt-zinc-cadmium resistance protein CzcA